jgi:hypothetical protein
MEIKRSWQSTQLRRAALIVAQLSRAEHPSNNAEMLGSGELGYKRR